uniref:D-3-phosphoglycerate dehydrogenase n=1 Tax=Clastoptera arizonana TaxID=38151 RepID=A0A1B6DGC0_9HEMI
MPVQIQNVLISDAVDQSCVDLLKAHNINVTCKYKLPKEQLIQEIKNYDGLIVRSDTKVTADVINASNLKVVGRAGTGVDNIDLNAATQKGVIVLNTPGGNSVSACELTCSLITCMARNVTQGCQSLKEGRWDRKLYTGNELSGKTLAVLGLGRIGREVAIRMQAFGMKTIGFDPLVSAEAAQQYNIEKKELNEIWPLADYITIHTPLIPQTKNMINDSVLTLCKRGVRIVNVARGGIVDEAALLKALQDGRAGGAALDVFLEEPPKNPVTLELIKHPKVVVTPHLGASTDEAQTRVAVEIAEEFIALANPESGFAITGAVNAPILTASLDATNNSYIQLATQLSRVAAKLVQDQPLKNVSVTIQTSGPGLDKMNFLSTASLVGILSSSRPSNGLNLINAPAIAKEAGLSVNQTYVPGDSPRVTVLVSAGSAKYTIQGVVRHNSPFLLNINEASFGPFGVVLTEDLQLFQGSNSGQDIQRIVESLNKIGVSIRNVSVAAGKSSYYALQTSQPIPNTLAPIQGVKTF